MNLFNENELAILSIITLSISAALFLLTAYFLANRKRKLFLYEKFLFCFWVLCAIAAILYSINLIIYIFFQNRQLSPINRTMMSLIYLSYFFQFISGFLFLLLKLNIKKSIIILIVGILSVIGLRILYFYIIESELVARYGEPYLAPSGGATQTYQVALFVFIAILLSLILLWLEFKKVNFSWHRLSGFYITAGPIMYAVLVFYQIFYAAYFNHYFTILHFLHPYLVYLSKKEEENQNQISDKVSINIKKRKSIFWRFFLIILTITFFTGLVYSFNIYQSYERILDTEVRTNPAFSSEKIKNIEVNIQNTWIASVTLFFLIFVLVIIISILFTSRALKQLYNVLFAIQEIKKGNQNIKVKIESEDEIAFLSKEFNLMVEKLNAVQSALEEEKKVLDIRIKARTRELAEMNQLLEEKVRERTRELQQKIDELERFHKLTVGREMKMIELKKEIEKLKQELGEFKKK